MTDPTNKPSPGYLRRAVEAGREEEVAALLARGADTEDLGGRDNNSPLGIAADRADLKIMQMLIDAGANLNHRNIHQDTPLLLAILDGEEREPVQLLIRSGADVNAQNVHGATALIWAVRENDPAIALMLIDKGADISLRDKEGRTALDWALRDGFENCIAMLKDAAGQAEDARKRQKHDSIVERQKKLKGLAQNRKGPRP